MKIICTFLFFGILMVSNAQNKRITRLEYIEQYKQDAIDEMRKTGIPASITLAQACLESDDGNSWLAKEANNHFGIKCGMNWNGEKVYKDDDNPNDCFRKYKSVKESFDDHSLYLTTTKRYAGLFQLETKDYKGWARGLKDAGYATNPQYADLLIKIIEDFQLYNFDENIKITTNQNKTNNQTGKTASEDWNIQLNKHEVKKNNDVLYIVIKQNDSFEGIAKEFDLWEKQLYKFNDLTKDSVLRIGQVLYIQPKRNKAEYGKDKHTVKQGETLYTISQYYAVKMKKLRYRNNIMSDQDVKPGDIIYLRTRRPLTPETIK
ncbi:MAG TPA: glucosaminidase domain-containing protein [Bacteroidales bacterium]|nr:LysM peptidoglycan-binding domain-containing protein [Bacteroidales bacterium]HNV96123.1 glucosaminidase domain-containing protein [Bacteroidales bacterium]